MDGNLDLVEMIKITDINYIWKELQNFPSFMEQELQKFLCYDR